MTEAESEPKLTIQIGNKRNGNDYSIEYGSVIQEKKFRVYKNRDLVELVTGVEPEKLESKYSQLLNWIDNSDEKKYLRFCLFSFYDFIKGTRLERNNLRFIINFTN